MSLQLLSLDEMKMVSGGASEEQMVNELGSVDKFEEWYKENGHKHPENHTSVPKYSDTTGPTSTTNVNGGVEISLSFWERLTGSANLQGGRTSTSGSWSHYDYAKKHCSGCHN